MALVCQRSQGSNSPGWAGVSAWRAIANRIADTLKTGAKEKWKDTTNAERLKARPDRNTELIENIEHCAKRMVTKELQLFTTTQSGICIAVESLSQSTVISNYKKPAPAVLALLEDVNA